MDDDGPCEWTLPPEVIEELLHEARAAAVVTRPPPQQRRPGRPRGTFGGPETRRALRAVLEEDTGPCPSEPCLPLAVRNKSALAHQPRPEKAPASALVSWILQGFAPGETLGEAFNFRGGLASGTPRYHEDSSRDRLFMSVLGPTPRFVTTIAAESKTSDSDRRLLSTQVCSMALCITVGARECWARLFESMRQKIDDGVLEPLATVSRTMYDETPMKLRPAPKRGSNELTANNQPEILKIFQGELHLGVLVRDATTGIHRHRPPNISDIVLPGHIFVGRVFSGISPRTLTLSPKGPHPTKQRCRVQRRASRRSRFSKTMAGMPNSCPMCAAMLAFNLGRCLVGRPIVCDVAGDVCFFHGGLPARLQATSSVTAEVVREVVRNWWHRGYPEFFEFREKFTANLEISISDRASGNLKYERMARGESKGTRLWLACEVHKVSNATGHGLNYLHSDVSGMVNLAMSMQRAGATTLFRRVLAVWVKVRLRVYEGAYPPGADSPEVQTRIAVFDLYLQGDSEATKRRRLVIEEFVNGAICANRPRLEHYCKPGHCRNAAHTLQVMQDAVVNALCPSAIPLFPRHRWTGSDVTLDSVGLLAAIGALKECVPVWAACIRENRDPEAADFPTMEEMDLDLGWETSGLEVAEPPVLEDLLADKDHKLWNEFARVDAVRFAASSPSPRIKVARICIAPAVRLLYSVLSTGGNQKGHRRRPEEDDQQRPWTPNKLGGSLDTFFTGVEQLLTDLDRWRALAADEQTSATSLLAFRILAKLGAVVFLLLQQSRQCFPHLLLQVLAHDNVDAAQQAMLEAQERPPCLRDGFAHDWFDNVMPKFDRFEDALLALRATANLMVTNTSRIECGHASLRRIVGGRGPLAHTLDFASASASFVCAKQRKWEERFTRTGPRTHIAKKRCTPPTATPNATGHKARCARYRVKLKRNRNIKQNGGGGAWRAFVSESSRGEWIEPKQMEELSLKYNTMKEENNDEFKRLAKKGRKATICRKLGGQSLFKTGRKIRRRPTKKLALQEAMFPRELRDALAALRKEGQLAKRRAITGQSSELALVKRRRHEAEGPSQARDLVMHALPSEARLVNQTLGSNDIKCIEWRHPAVDLSRDWFKRSTVQQLRAGRDAWEESHETLTPVMCSPCVEQPKKKVTPCSYTGMCIHTEPGKSIAAFERKFSGTLKKLFPKKTQARAMLEKGGSVVICLLSSTDDHEWFYVSHMNYNTWLAVLLRLRPSECPLRPRPSGSSNRKCARLVV